MASPYPLDGIIYESNGTTAVVSLTVSVMNVSTGETQTITTNSSGQYLVECANFTSGYTNGDVISIWASYGRYYKEELHTIDTSVGSGTENLTLSDTLYTHAVYCSVDDVRAYFRLTDHDATDTQVHKMILQATSMIDERTGRTWKGVQTKTDEYYDGNGTRMLTLNRTDVVSLTSLSIDDDDDGTFTTVTTTYVWLYEDGRLVLKDDAEVTSFTSGNRNVKMTYTYGNSRPTEEVKHLAILIVGNMLSEDTNYRRREIEDMISRLKMKMVDII